MDDFSATEKAFIDQGAADLQESLEKTIHKFMTGHGDIEFELTINCVFNAVLSTSYRMMVVMYPNFIIPKIHQSFAYGLNEAITKYLLVANINPSKETMQ